MPLLHTLLQNKYRIVTTVRSETAAARIHPRVVTNHRNTTNVPKTSRGAFFLSVLTLPDIILSGHPHAGIPSSPFALISG